MEKVLFKLKEFIVKSISPNNLFGKEEMTTSLKRWDSLWSNESEIIKQDFADHSAVSYEHNVAMLSGLTSLSDIVNSYLTDYRKIWQKNQGAEQVKFLYQHIDHDLQSFTELLSGFYPEAFQLAPFPVKELSTVKQSLNIKYRQLETHLANPTIDDHLIAILTKTISGYIRRPGLTRRESDYLLQLMNGVMASTITDTTDLKIILYQRNFNNPEFFIYWVNEWNRLLGEEPGLYEQMELLIKEQDRLSNLRVQLHARLLLSDESLNVELAKYLYEKRQTVNDLIKLRRARLQDNELAKLAQRIKINMPVAQLGLFIRLQLEKGILLKDNVGKLFSFYATHFYTPQTDSISPQSLQKKSTEIEYATAQKLKAVLISMINWLNENFKLSDS